MSGSNVPVPTFTANGFVAPSVADILTGVRADFAAAFGAGLNPADDTPQGQLAVSLTAIINAANAAFLQVANGVDPAYASGRFQDAIGRIYFLERTPAEPTTVTGTCYGLTGATIPLGALAVSTDGNIYAATTSGVIPAGGSVNIQFACTQTGPIPCAAGALNRIYQALPGWDSVVNAADGVLGNDVEGRTAFEARRQASVAGNSQSTVPAIRGSLLAVSNVLDAFVTDNSTASSITVGGVVIAPRTLYCCVSGGTDSDVAMAIWRKKPPGCGYTGTTSVTVYDTTQGYAVPPAYTVQFTRAAPLTLTFAVSIVNSPSVPSNAGDLIDAAILNALAGGDGGPRAQIGVTQYASRYVSAVTSLGAWAQVLALTINGGASVTVNANQIPTSTASDITTTLV